MGLNPESLIPMYDKHQRGMGERLNFESVTKRRGAYYVNVIQGVRVNEASSRVCVHCPLHGSGKGNCCGVDKLGKIVISAACESPKLLAGALCNLLNYIPTS